MTTTIAPRRDLRRTYRLLSEFRFEQSDPSRYYTMLAEDSAALLGAHLDLRGATILDIGGGPGYTAAALRSAGAHAFTVDRACAGAMLVVRADDDVEVRRLPGWP